MSELWLREHLDRAVASEPPMGPVAANSLRAALRRRRRRRAQGTAVCAAAVAVIAAASLAVAGAGRHPANGPANGRAKVTRPSTLYVLSSRGTLTPIPSATNVPGEPIPVGGEDEVMAVTPDGKTIYVDGGGSNLVIPVSTVTNTAGKPIPAGRDATQILITPDGKTAYVLDAFSTITPIATATNTPGKAIKVGLTGGSSSQMAITPDGKTLYVVSWTPGGLGPSYVIPIATATNTPGKPIKIEDADSVEIVMNPDGRTAYVLGSSTTGTKIVPIATATNTVGKPVSAGDAVGDLAIMPDGQILYVVDHGPFGVMPFATATKTPGNLIKVGGMALSVAVTPDGKTAYVSSETGTMVNATCAGQTGEVTPVTTATNVPGRPVRVGCRPYFLAITPDGQTIWVASGRHTVTPIATATNTPGKPIKIRGGINGIMVAP
jgi:DNA-binding beta-propeller fold protein YncE